MKYLQFIKMETKTKTDVYNMVRPDDNNVHLGQIKWLPSWRRYVLFPSTNTCFDSGCLADIQNFIIQLMNERKESKN